MSENPWPTVVLGDPAIATTTSGGTPSRANKKYFGGEIHWIKSGDLNDGHLLGSAEKITESALSNSSARLLQPSAVLIAMYGATVGKTGLLKVPAASNQAVCAIQANPAIYNPQFLQYLLISKRAHLLNERYGGAQPNISQAIVRALELPCPELVEQERVAAVLWKTQRAAELEEKLAATARELKAATMRQLFSSGLNSEPQKETEIGLIPKSWGVQPLEELREFLQYGTSVKCDLRPHGNPVIRIPNVADGEVQLSDLKYCELPEGVIDNLALVEGDLVFIRTNGVRERVGTCAVYRGEPKRALFASYLIRCRPKAEKLISDFLNYYCMTAVGRAFLAGRASPAADGKFNVNTKHIDSVLVPVPHPDEQQAIVTALRSIDRKISVHERHAATLRELFASLLYRLMTGEVRVDKLDIDVSEVRA